MILLDNILGYVLLDHMIILIWRRILHYCIKYILRKELEILHHASYACAHMSAKACVKVHAQTHHDQVWRIYQHGWQNSACGCHIRQERNCAHECAKSSYRHAFAMMNFEKAG